MPTTHLRGVLLIAAAACYLSWMFGLVLAGSLSPVDSFASELAVAGQPHAWLYRAGDLLAGTLLAGAALLHLVERRVGGRLRAWARLVPLLLLTFALATIVDALLPMSCVETLDRACRARVAAGSVPLAHRVHLWTSSVAGASCWMVLLIQARRAVLHRTHRELVVLTGVWSACTLWVLAGQLPGFHLAAIGLAQRTSLALTSTWLACWGWRLLGAGRPRRAQSTSSPARSRSSSSASRLARQRSA